MIDNVITIIEGSRNNTNKLIISGRIEPLGYLPEIGGLLNMELNKIDEIYEDILIDTEVGYYYSKFLEEAISAFDNKNINNIQSYLQELPSEKIKNYLKKIWFENFYLYCQTLNDTTKEIMMELLNYEADYQTINIIYNSLAYDFNLTQESERKKFIPNFGYLYPTITNNLYKVSSIEGLREALR